LKQSSARLEWSKKAFQFHNAPGDLISLQLKPRVLIISASTGSGHVAAGAALAKAFARDDRVAEVVHKDALHFTNKLFRDFYSRGYDTMIRSAPTLFGWAYRSSDEPWKTDSVRLRLDRLNTGPLVKFIRQFDPHITVCTHFMPAGIISHLIESKQLRTHLAVVVTDFDCHAMWLSRTFHRYFVAIDEAKAHLEALGLPGHRITISGIPIDPMFCTRIDRARARERYGLNPRKTTLLVSAGALGAGPTEHIVAQFKHLRHDVQTVVCCGRADDLQQRVRDLVRGEGSRFHVLGFSDRMFELMQMADLFIGKPGGLTASEALACGLPMVISSPIPGQEERNSDHLLEEGAAIKCNDLTTIPYKIDLLLDEPERLSSMRRNALRIAKPAAARTIVETLLKDDLPALRWHTEKRGLIAQLMTGHAN
jgi:processive 1,2-diacylglycerol beta-glucosyltransferase